MNAEGRAVGFIRNTTKNRTKNKKNRLKNSFACRHALGHAKQTDNKQYAIVKTHHAGLMKNRHA